MTEKLDYDPNKINILISTGGVLTDEYMFLTSDKIKIGLNGRLSYTLNSCSSDVKEEDAVKHYNKITLEHIFKKGNIIPDIILASKGKKGSSLGIIEITEGKNIITKKGDKKGDKKGQEKQLVVLNSMEPFNTKSMWNKSRLVGSGASNHMYLSSIIRYLYTKYKDDSREIQIKVKACLGMKDNVYNKCIFDMVGKIEKQKFHIYNIKTIDLKMDDKDRDAPVRFTDINIKSLSQRYKHLPDIYEIGEERVTKGVFVPTEEEYLRLERIKKEKKELSKRTVLERLRSKKKTHEQVVITSPTDPKHPKPKKKIWQKKDTSDYVTECMITPFVFEKRFGNGQAEAVFKSIFNKTSLSVENIKKFMNPSPFVIKLVYFNDASGSKKSYYTQIQDFPSNRCTNTYKHFKKFTDLLEKRNVMRMSTKDKRNLKTLTTSKFYLKWIVIYYLNSTKMKDETFGNVDEKQLIKSKIEQLTAKNDFFKIDIFNVAGLIYNRFKDITIPKQENMYIFKMLENVKDMALDVVKLQRGEEDGGCGKPFDLKRVNKSDSGIKPCHPFLIIKGGVTCLFSILNIIINVDGSINKDMLQILILMYEASYVEIRKINKLKGDLLRKNAKSFLADHTWYKGEDFNTDNIDKDIYDILVLIRCLNSIDFDNSKMSMCENITTDKEKYLDMLRRIHGKVLLTVAFGAIKTINEK